MLHRVAIGRSTLAELLGGWLVQTRSRVATGTLAGSGLADVVVLDQPTPSTLTEIAALFPDRQQRIPVWSLEPIPASRGWTSLPNHVLVTFPRRSHDGVAHPADRNGRRAARVADVSGVARLRSILHGRGFTEPIDQQLLGSPEVRAWIVEDDGAAGALFAAVVDHLDVVAAAATDPRSMKALLHAWRRDKPDFEGAAVLPTQVMSEGSRGLGGQPLFVATASPAFPGT